MPSGPAPKDPSKRVRRNAQPEVDVLPAEGRAGRAPSLPNPHGGPKLLKQTRDMWREIWKSPPAVRWDVRSDMPGLVRWAHLFDQMLRGETSGLAQLTQLEDRYGLSPWARQKNRMRIASAPSPGGRVVEPEVSSRAAGEDPRLRLIAGGASSVSA